MQTTRQTIITDEMVRELMRLGHDYVQRVTNRHTELSTAEKTLADFLANGIKTTQERLGEIEGIIGYEVASDTTLSNDTKRKAAIAKRLQEDKEYQTHRGILAAQHSQKLELEQKVQLAKIQLETARNTLSAWHTEMSVIAGLSREVAQEVEFRHVLTMERVK